MSKQYFPITSDRDQTINFMRVDFVYNKGGMNVWTYKREPRGYYLMFTPVQRDGIMEGFTAFTGKKYIITEVSRASAKAEREAKAEADQFIEDMLEHVCEQLGCHLVREEQE